MLLTSLLAVAAVVCQAPSAIEITDSVHGCYVDRDERYAWKRDGDAYTLGDRRLSAADVDALRLQILRCKMDPPDLLAKIGFTKESLAARRSAIIDAHAPAIWRNSDGSVKTLPPQLAELMAYERLAPHVLNELKGNNWTSTTRQSFEAVLPGEPQITISSSGETPWMLPWTVKVNGQSWTVADPAVSVIAAKFADPKGPCARLLDGRAYWAEAFWSDDHFWGRFVGRELDGAVSKEVHQRLGGYEAFAKRFRVVESETGEINMLPLALFLRVEAMQPTLVDQVWWWNFIEDDKPTLTWHAFLRTYDDAVAVVAKHRWLLDWKSAAPDRHLELQMAGTEPHSETMIEELVRPAWVHAGLRGKPAIEVMLRRGKEWCGTVYLHPDAPQSLIETAHKGQGPHWFDRLEFSFHPRAKPPTYGLVDTSGKLEIRTMP